MKQFSFHTLTTPELHNAVTQEFSTNSRLKEMLTAFAERVVLESQQRLIKYPPDVLTASTSNRELGRQESMNHLLTLIDKELA
jgi:hypothetical protein